LARIAREGCAVLQLLEDLVGIIERLGLGRRGRREEDFADAIFLGTLRCVHPVEHRFDLVVADVDRAFDLGVLEPLPCDLGLDLATHRADRGAVGVEIRGHLLGRLLDARRDAADGFLDIRLLDFDLLVLGCLDLEGLVDEVAQDLLTQGIDLVGGNSPTVRDRQKREPLVDVGPGDHLAVDDGGRLDHRRHRVAE